MKARVTLVNPPYPRGAPQSLFIPLGIGYLAAVLEKNQYDVEVIDYQGLNPTRKQLEAELIKSHPDVVGVTTSTLTYNPALDIVKAAKEVLPNCLTILGGPHVTVLDEQTLSEAPEADVIVRGEGEQTMLEHADLASKSELKKLGQVEGITFRNGEKTFQTPNRTFIQDLDQLPHPAYKYFPLDSYRVFGKLFLPIITSRGCPFQCAFCTSSRMFGKQFRARSPKNIVDELEMLRDVYGADAFTFYDDTLTLERNRIFEICELIKNRKIGIPWDCQTRVDQVSKEVLTKMRETNCQQIFFGVESGCQEILDALRKKTSIEQNANAIKWAKDAGLFVAISVMVGYPGETTDTLKQTLDFVRKTKPDDVYLCVATPYPGTELRRLVEDMGLEMSTDWGLYDTITPVFENPLLPAEEIRRIRTEFYDSFYSPMYVLRHLFKSNFYGRIMARTAVNHLIWRIRLWRGRSAF